MSNQSPLHAQGVGCILILAALAAAVWWWLSTPANREANR